MKALALAGPLVLVALVCARLDARSTSTPHAHVFLAQELVLIAGAAFLTGAAAWMKLRVRRDALALAIGALAVLEIASVVCATDVWLAVRSASVWLAGLAVLVVAREIDRPARRLAISALLAPLGIVAGSIILEALGVVQLSARHHAPGGLLGERNVGGELLVAGAPAIAWTYLAGGPVWVRRAALVVAALATCAVVLTRTRSAWLAGLVLVGALVVGLVSTLRRHGVEGRGRVVRLGAAAALGVLLALALPTTLRWRSVHPYRDSLVHLVDARSPSGAGRIVQYATTWRMAAANAVVGVGPGNWAAQYLSFAKRGDRTVHEGLAPVNRLPNSDVLGFAAERGLLATAVLGLLAVLLVRRGGPSRSLRVLRHATLLVVFVMASLDAVLQTPAALLIVAWIVGVCSAGTVRSKAPAAPKQSSSPRLGFAFAAAVLVVASVPAGRRLLSLEVAAHARGSYDLDRAARLDPGDVALRLSVAESWIGDGRCDRAREHLDAVSRFSPASPALAELAARCSWVSVR